MNQQELSFDAAAGSGLSEHPDKLNRRIQDWRYTRRMLVLGIESSCDETAAAVVEDGRRILSNVIHSQVKTHKPYGGIVPELASREHLAKIRGIVDQALSDSGKTLADMDGIAATAGPGLIGSLLVGLTYAKALAYSRKKPLAAVNHIEGHIYSVCFDHPGAEFPALALVVSGGHTNLFWVESKTGDFRHLTYKLVGKTRDDAAGEAYDKVAKLLGLPYPGGPVIDRLAKLGNPKALRFAIPKISDRSLDFSFSGVKTAVLRIVKSEGLAAKNEEETRKDPARLDLLASFQESVVEMLWSTTHKAITLMQPRSLMLSGGVAANSRLTEYLREKTAECGLKFYVPARILTTDNAAMIAAAGTAQLMRGESVGFDFDADPNMRLAVPENGFPDRRWRV